MNNEVNAQSDGHLYIVSPRGYSAYEIAVQNGFEGTEEEWLASLKGDTGETGPQGKSAYQVAVDNGFEGTEEDFVNQYINADNYYNKDEIDKRITHVFGVVNDMIHTDLKAGNIVATMGYHNLSDGGGGLYMIISTDVYLIIDNGSMFHLDNGLYAKLISEESIRVSQFGAYGDGTHDDTEKINNAIKYANNQHKTTIIFESGKVYNVKPYLDSDTQGGSATTNIHGVMLKDNITLDLNNAEIKAIANNRTNYNIFTLSNVSNICIKNGKITGDMDTHNGSTGEWGYGISLRNTENIILDNLYISKCWGDGINLNAQTNGSDNNKNITITNCICDDNRRQGMSIELGENIYVENCQFINTGSTSYVAPGAGIDIEPSFKNAKVLNTIIENCVFRNNYNEGFTGNAAAAISGCQIKDLFIRNCLFDSNKALTSTTGFTIARCENVFIEHNVFKNEKRFLFNPIKYLKLNDNKIELTWISLSFASLNDGKIEILNNILDSKTNAITSNAIIETAAYTFDTFNDNVLNIYNNEIISNNTANNAYALVILRNTANLSKAILRNNKLMFGKRAIICSTSAIIEDNNIIGQTIESINLGNSKEGFTSIIHINNNLFEQSAKRGNSAYVITNAKTTNLIVTNNKYLPITLNPSNQSSDNFAKVGFLSNSTLTGYSLDDNNVIIAQQ